MEIVACVDTDGAGWHIEQVLDRQYFSMCATTIDNSVLLTAKLNNGKGTEKDS